MDSSYPKMVPKWTLPVQNGLFYSQNGLFWSLNGPKMESSSPKMDSSSPKMDSSSPKLDSSGPKIVPFQFLLSLKVVFQMCLEKTFFLKLFWVKEFFFIEFLFSQSLITKIWPNTISFPYFSHAIELGSWIILFQGPGRRPRKIMRVRHPVYL